MKLLEKKVHTFLSLFAVAENSAQFFNLVDGGWSSNSCMKLLEKKCTLFCRYFPWWGWGKIVHNFLTLLMVDGPVIRA